MVEYRGWRRGPVEEEAAWGWSGSVRRSGSGGCPRWSWCASRWSASSGSTASWARWWRSAPCGLAGIKPSGGLIGRRPIPDWIDLSTDGPLATSVEDLRLLLAIEAGPVAGDPTALPVPPALERGERPARPGRVLAAPRFVPWGPLPADVAELFDAALLALERDLGLAIEPVEPERIFRAGNLDEDWLTLTTTEHAHKLGRDTIEANRHLLHPAGRAFLEHGLRTPIEEYLAARRRRFEYVRELDELLGADGVIVTPTLASAGWLAEGKMPGSRHFGIPDEVYNTAPANVTGHPSLSLPAGHFGSGVRFGLQFTGPRFRDDLLLDLGEAWQRARPWPPVADGYEPFDLPS